MLWIKLAYRNIVRNKSRSFVSIAAIAGSIILLTFMDNMQTGSYNAMINNGIKSGSGHIGIYHSNYLSSRELEDSFDFQLVKQSLLNKDIKKYYPRLYVPSLIRSSRNSSGGVVLGLDILKERNISPLLKDKVLIDGDWPRPNNSKDVLIGYKLAKELSLGVGKKFVVMAKGNHDEINSKLFRIRGIIKAGVSNIDKTTIITHLSNVQKLIQSKDRVHEVAIHLSSFEQIKDNLNLLSQQIPAPIKAFSWQEAQPSLLDLIKIDRANGIMMGTFLMLIVGIGAINTMVMSVMDRTREFGVLRAIGMNSSYIRLIVFLEALILGFIAIFIGMIISLLLTYYTSTHGIDFSEVMKDMDVAGVMIDPIIYTVLNLKGNLLICLSMLIINILSSIYPAYLATTIEPAQAMQRK
ncbi:MAG: ABC transporter permease [Candidatus Cloacimonetes bacterium]|nr:ABC transporter permease [Candidatus Cloacimonadota bacterium]